MDKSTISLLLLSAAILDIRWGGVLGQITLSLLNSSADGIFANQVYALQCKVRGVARPITVTWTGLCGDPFNKSLSQSEYNETRKITLQWRDNGKNCKCSAGTKSIYGLVTYNVLFPPVVISPSQSTTHRSIGVNSKIGFSVVVHCNPQPDFYWTFNRPISETIQMKPKRLDRDKYSSTFYIERVKLENKGNYICWIGNTKFTYGNQKRRFTLHVISPPKEVVLTANTTTTTKTGEGIELKCLVGQSSPAVSKLEWSEYCGSSSTEVCNAAGNGICQKRILTMSARYNKKSCECSVNYTSLQTPLVLKSSVKFFVSYPPTFVSPVKPDETVAVAENTDLTLNCSVKSRPLSTVSWVLGNGGVDGQHKVSVAQQSDDFVTSLLLIKKISRRDARRYKCVVNNSQWLTVSRDVDVDVQYPPDGVTLVGNAMGYVGTIVNFTCSSGDANPPATDVKFTGSCGNLIGNIQNSVIHSSLTLKTELNGKGCTCTASNELGHRSKTITITILKALSITVPHENSAVRVVNEGGFIMLICNSTGSPIPSLSWKMPKLNRKIMVENPVATDYAVSKIHLVNVTRHYSGNYTCVSNNKLSSERKTYILDVRYPPNFIRLTGSANVFVNTTITLTCVSGPSNPLPAFVFKGNCGATIKKSPYKYTATILVSRSHQGRNCSCTAGNYLKFYQKIITFNVFYHPVITLPTDKTSNIVAVEYSNVTLRCNVSANPKAQIQWSDPNGMVLRDQQDTIDTFSFTSTINLVRITRSQAGQYKCQVVGRNEARSFTVDVQYPPHNIKLSGSTNVTSGENVSLTCSVSQSNPPNTLKFTGSCGTTDPVSDSTRRSTHIVSSRVLDGKTCQCSASNTHGRVQTSVTIGVSYPPHFISPKHDNRVNQLITVSKLHDVNITCVVVSKPLPTVVWSRYTETPADSQYFQDIDGFRVTSTYRLKKVKDTSVGLYHCTFNNGIGNDVWASFNLTIAADKPPVGPVETPGKVNIIILVVVIVLVVVIFLFFVICIAFIYRRRKANSVSGNDKVNKNRYVHVSRTSPDGNIDMFLHTPKPDYDEDADSIKKSLDLLDCTILDDSNSHFNDTFTNDFDPFEKHNISSLTTTTVKSGESSTTNNSLDIPMDYTLVKRPGARPRHRKHRTPNGSFYTCIKKRRPSDNHKNDVFYINRSLSEHYPDVLPYNTYKTSLSDSTEDPTDVSYSSASRPLHRNEKIILSMNFN